MDDYRNWFAVIAIFLMFYSYFFYVRSILQHKTKPHVFTWVIWLITTSIAASIQVMGDAKAGAWPTIAVMIICICIVILSLKYGSRDIKRIDVVFLVACLCAIPCWLFIDNPAYAAIFVTGIELAAAFPTIRKSWSRPQDEVAFPYAISSVRYTLSILALYSFSIETVIYPFGMFLKNVLIFLFLTIRTRKIGPIIPDTDMNER